ncbi:hypothetical protein [Streptomyces sp. 3N207]|uniref:hypothetical protein n=1 Tax=Streptomyces sp. 3N207 TaxID=3457417 RepID=UPI003FD60DAD
MGDVAESVGPLTPEAEAHLREQHRAAAASNQHCGEVQALQDKLEAADEETRRIKTRQRALEEALHDREGKLQDAWNRSRQLERQFDEQHLVHQAELAQWQAEYKQLGTDCVDLNQQVIYLKESLAVTRAELIAAEEECHRLEAQLEALAETAQGSLKASSLLEALEAADQTASVPELVSVVGDLELRTQRAMASELVTSVSRTRNIVEVAALLEALQAAGLHTHAQTTLPTLLMARSVEDIGRLTAELHRLGLDTCVVTTLRSAVELYQTRDLAHLASLLHHCALTEHATSLLGAVAVVRPVADVVALVTWLPGEMSAVAEAALTPAAVQRPVQELVDLSLSLRHAGRERSALQLVSTAGTQRPAHDVAALADALSARELRSESSSVLRQAGKRDVWVLLGVLHGLRATGRLCEADALLQHALATRDVADLALIVHDLHSRENYGEATTALLRTLCSSRCSTRAFIECLESSSLDAEALLETAALVGSPESIAAVIGELVRSGLAKLSEVVFYCATGRRPTGFSGRLLEILCGVNSPYASPSWLSDLALSRSASEVAVVLLALNSASLTAQLRLVLTSYVGGHEPAGIVALYKQLYRLDHPMEPRFDAICTAIEKAVVDQQPVSYQVILTQQLLEETSGRSSGAARGPSTRAARLSARADAADPTFKRALNTAQTRYAQRLFSREFWARHPSSSTSRTE